MGQRTGAGDGLSTIDGTTGEIGLPGNGSGGLKGGSRSPLFDGREDQDAVVVDVCNPNRVADGEKAAGSPARLKFADGRRAVEVDAEYAGGGLSSEKRRVPHQDASVARGVG